MFILERYSRMFREETGLGFFVFSQVRLHLQTERNLEEPPRILVEMRYL